MHLPNDIVVSIISFCPIATVTSAKLTCKSWNRILCTEIFWKALCQNQLGITNDQPTEKSWELEYKRNFEIAFCDTDTFLLSRLKSICDGDPQFEDELLSLLADAFNEQKAFFSQLSSIGNCCTNKHCDIYVRFYKLVGCFKNIGAPRLARILETAEIVFANKWNCRDYSLATQFFKQATYEWSAFTARVQEYKNLRKLHVKVHPTNINTRTIDGGMINMIQSVWKYWC